MKNTSVEGGGRGVLSDEDGDSKFMGQEPDKSHEVNKTL